MILEQEGRVTIEAHVTKDILTKQHRHKLLCFILNICIIQWTVLIAVALHTSSYIQDY